MSKSVKKDTGKAVILSKGFKALMELTIASRDKAMKARGVKAIALLVLAIVCWHLYTAGSASLAALYLFADNGKKSGRTGGNVYMRNGRTRGFTVPALVRNAFTALARTRFSTLSSGWNALTPSEQESWINVTNVFFIDRFANSHILKGKALYISWNASLMNLGIAVNTTFPGNFAIAGIDVLSADADVSLGTFDLTFSNSPTAAHVPHLVFATAQLPAGVYRPSPSAFRQIDIIPAASAAPFSIMTTYSAKFGIPVEGRKIFVQVVPIMDLTGQQGVILQTDTIVHA